MSISLAAAIKSVKEDEHWVKKVVTGGFVLLFYFVVISLAESHKTDLIGIISFIAGIISWLYFSGFYCSTGNKMINENTNAMDEWCKPNQLLIGLKYVTGSLIFGVIIGLIAMIVFLLIGLLLGLLSGIAGKGIFVMSFIKLFTIVFGLVAGLYIAQFINIMVLSFYKSLKIRDMLAIKRHFRIIKENRYMSWSLIGKNILWGLLFVLVIAICAVTIVGVVLVPFVYFAACVAAINLLVQYGREIDIQKYV